MKKKLYIILLIVFICFFTKQAITQSFDGFYYVDEKTQYWETDSTSVNLIIKNVENIDSIAHNLLQIFKDKNDIVEYSDEDDNIIINSKNFVKQ